MPPAPFPVRCPCGADVYITLRACSLPADPADKQDSNSTASNATAGALDLMLTQSKHSLTTIEDIDPIDIGAFLGNLGGFWGKNCRQRRLFIKHVGAGLFSGSCVLASERRTYNLYF